MKVVKRSGKVEEFSVEKLRTSMLRAGGSSKEADAITASFVKKFRDRKELESKEIRDYVLSELLKMNEKVSAQYSGFQKKIAEISIKHAGLIEERLGALCVGTAKLSYAYGGFEIIVEKPVFDWRIVFELLLESGFQVSVSKKGSHLVISARPST